MKTAAAQSILRPLQALVAGSGDMLQNLEGKATNFVAPPMWHLVIMVPQEKPLDWDGIRLLWDDSDKPEVRSAMDFTFHDLPPSRKHRQKRTVPSGNLT